MPCSCSNDVALSNHVIVIPSSYPSIQPPGKYVFSTSGGCQLFNKRSIWCCFRQINERHNISRPFSTLKPRARKKRRRCASDGIYQQHLIWNLLLEKFLLTNLNHSIHFHIDWLIDWYLYQILYVTKRQSFRDDSRLLDAFVERELHIWQNHQCRATGVPFEPQNHE